MQKQKLMLGEEDLRMKYQVEIDIVSDLVIKLRGFMLELNLTRDDEPYMRAILKDIKAMVDGMLER